MRSFLGQVPVLCLTATADKGMRKRLVNYLAMHNPYKVILSPNKDNIRFTVRQADKELSCLNWLVSLLEEQGDNCPHTILFCQTVNDIVLILSFLLMKLGDKAYVPGEAPVAERCLISVYYSVTPQRMKERVTNSFENGTGKARVVIATTSLSMGVDFPKVTYVVHFGPSRDIVSHLQEAGRAGRDGVSQAYNVVFYLGKHKALCSGNMKKVINSNECVRKVLFSFFDDTKAIVPKHNCCNRCHENCRCGGDECSQPLPVFEKASVSSSHAGPTRSVTDEDRECLRAALYEVKSSLTLQTKVSLFDKTGTISHGLSEKVIETVVMKCDQLFTMMDIFQQCFILSPRLSIIILEILNELFGDVPTTDITREVSTMTESLIPPLFEKELDTEMPIEDDSDDDDFDEEWL